jgi:hypothetical protein
MLNLKLRRTCHFVGKMQPLSCKVPSSCSTPGLTSTDSTSRSSSSPSNIRADHEGKAQSVQKDFMPKHSEKSLTACKSNAQNDTTVPPKGGSGMMAEWNVDALGETAKEVEPKYKVVYRSRLNLAQFWYAPNRTGS